MPDDNFQPIVDHVSTRLSVLMDELGVDKAELKRRTRISMERINQFLDGTWLQIKKEEIGKLTHFFDTRVAHLFETHRKSFFYSVKSGGSLELHLCSRTTEGLPGGDPLPPVNSFDDLVAASSILKYAARNGLPAFLTTHDPNVSEAEYRRIVSNGSHQFVGLQGELGEHALCSMVGAPAFDDSCHRMFAYNLIRGHEYTDKSSLVRVGPEHGIDCQGIYSNLTDEMVARRTHRTNGQGLDCGLIAIVRIPIPVDGHYEGERRDRFIVVLGGHGRAGTRSCALALLDEANQDRLYPVEPNAPKLFVVSTRYKVRNSNTTELSDIRIVEESPALNHQA